MDHWVTTTKGSSRTGQSWELGKKIIWQSTAEVSEIWNLPKTTHSPTPQEPWPPTIPSSLKRHSQQLEPSSEKASVTFKGSVISRLIRTMRPMTSSTEAGPMMRRQTVPSFLKQKHSSIYSKTKTLLRSRRWPMETRLPLPSISGSCHRLEAESKISISFECGCKSVW